MKRSLLEKASLPSPQHKEYLINYFFLGSNKSSEPDSWNLTLQNIQNNLGWDKRRDSFNKFVSQVSIGGIEYMQSVALVFLVSYSPFHSLNIISHLLGLAISRTATLSSCSPCSGGRLSRVTGTMPTHTLTTESAASSSLRDTTNLPSQ